MIGHEQCGNILLGGPTEKSPIEKGLQYYLKDCVGSGVKVFYLRRPQSIKSLPCIVFEKDSEERTDCLDTPATEAVYGFTINVWSLNPEECISIYDAVRGSLENYKGIIHGRKVSAVWVENDVDNSESVDDGSDILIYSRSTSYGMIVDD